MKKEADKNIFSRRELYLAIGVLALAVASCTKLRPSEISIPDVINHPEAPMPVSWEGAVNLADKDCDQNLIKELIDKNGLDGYGIYFGRLMNRAFNVKIGPPPAYDVLSSEIDHWIGKPLHDSDNSCYITWVHHSGEQFLIYPNNDGQTVLIPVTEGP